MNLKFRKVLENIDFLKRYSKLSKKYDSIRTPNEKRLTKPDGIEVCDIFEDMGYDLEFSKGVDKFAYFDEKYEDYKFSFRFSLSNGTAEFILAIWENEELLVGTNFGMMSKELGVIETIKKPVFSNYTELKDILKTAIEIYLNCKAELIKLKGVEFKEPERIYKIGISEHSVLEQIIPAPYHELANEFIFDFNNMDNFDFFKKYRLNGNLWHTPEDFMIARENSDTFGKVLVRFLESKGCFKKYLPTMRINANQITNHWNDGEKVKLVYLYIADGTRHYKERYYYAFIPENVDLDNILGIEIRYPKYEE